MNLEKLNLTVRSRNLLLRAAITTSEQLAQYSREQLLQLRNAREADVDNIERALAEIGLSLSPAPKAGNPRQSFIESYGEPLKSQLKAHRLFCPADFADVTLHYLLTMPGITPDALAELVHDLRRKGVELAKREPGDSPSTRYCFAERYPEPLQSQLKLRGLYNKIDFAEVTKVYVAAIPGMTPQLLDELEDELEFCGILFSKRVTPAY